MSLDVLKLYRGEDVVRQNPDDVDPLESEQKNLALAAISWLWFIRGQGKLYPEPSFIRYSLTTLVHPDPSARVFLAFEASDTRVGAMLQQQA